jgi:hypothetical protein
LSGGDHELETGLGEIIGVRSRVGGDKNSINSSLSFFIFMFIKMLISKRYFVDFE